LKLVIRIAQALRQLRYPRRFRSGLIEAGSPRCFHTPHMNLSEAFSCGASMGSSGLDRVC
jgi:hypothetical protein